MSKNSEKQKRWREMNEKVLEFYEHITGIERKDVRFFIKLGKEMYEKCEKDLK